MSAASASSANNSGSEENSSTRIIVKVAQDTVLKASIKQQSELSSSEKKFVEAGTLMAGELRGKESGHFKVWLEDDDKDEEWFLYEGHVDILNVVSVQ